MNLFAWALYLLAPPKPRLLTWPLDLLSARARPVDLSPTARASTTADPCRPDPAVAPRRCHVLTAHGIERWDYL